MSKNQAICPICNKLYVYGKGTGATREKCASCCVTFRRKRIRYTLILENGGCCSICGYSRCSRALIFHHKDLSIRAPCISDILCKSLSRIKEEVAKTILVCSNCHLELNEENSTKQDKM